MYVMRAAQSKGIVDLLAVFSPHHNELYGCPPIWFVQAKRDGRLPGREKVELVSVAEAAGAVPVLAKTGPNGRGVEFITLGG